MSDHVYKTVEVTGSSPDVISDAVRTAVAKASQTLRNLEWFEVVSVRGHIAEDGGVEHYQVTLKIGFRLED
jgi:flavin-binding protein dodecin